MNRSVTVLLIFILFISLNILAQESDTTGMNDQPGFLVLSQNIVPMAEMQDVLNQGDSLAAPILDELVNEGLLYRMGRINSCLGRRIQL